MTQENTSKKPVVGLIAGVPAREEWDHFAMDRAILEAAGLGSALLCKYGAQIACDDSGFLPVFERMAKGHGKDDTKQVQPLTTGLIEASKIDMLVAIGSEAGTNLTTMDALIKAAVAKNIPVIVISNKNYRQVELQTLYELNNGISLKENVALIGPSDAADKIGNMLAHYIRHFNERPVHNKPTPPPPPAPGF